jgi:DNA polymerase (family X)
VAHSNTALAARLDEVASLLEEQHANPYRVRAYRNAAASLRRLDTPIDDVYRQHGLAGLEALPAVGESIARSLRALLTTGRLPMLERLRGASDPEGLLMTVPGIGRKTAERLHEELGIDSLEALELAAHDGRLEVLAGIGPKRLQGIRELLAARLGRWRSYPLEAAASLAGGEPAVAELLDVDREYRERASQGTLHKIAPKRMNPGMQAWLPVLHTERGPRHFTALYSNTPRAHQLGRTDDWVVLYCDAGDGERQYTVVTGRQGRLAGRRVVRGREAECERYYGPAPED